MTLCKSHIQQMFYHSLDLSQVSDTGSPEPLVSERSDKFTSCSEEYSNIYKYNDYYCIIQNYTKKYKKVLNLDQRILFYKLFNPDIKK